MIFNTLYRYIHFIVLSSTHCLLTQLNAICEMIKIWFSFPLYMVIFVSI